MTGTGNNRYDAKYVFTGHGDNRVIPFKADEFRGRDSPLSAAAVEFGRAFGCSAETAGHLTNAEL
jgi:hypothetical protein